MGLPYYSLYPSDFDADEKIRLMEDEELGLFMRCMNHAWLNDGLPADPEEIRRALRDSPEAFSRKWQRVQECFPISEGGRRRNPRQERERAAALDKTQKAKRGAEASWQSRRNANAMRTHMQTQSECIADAMPRAYGSGSVSDSDSKNQETTNLRVIPKPAPSPADADAARERAVSMWKAAGFDGPEQANAWWNSLVSKHPNPNGNNYAYGRWLELIQAGQFDRTEFERWYEEQVPIWAEWNSRNIQAKNLNDIFTDRLWKFKPAALPKPQKSDRERGLAG